LGGLEKTAQWANAIIAGQIALSATGGFSVSHELV
jgi:hypothetical protein